LTLPIVVNLEVPVKVDVSKGVASKLPGLSNESGSDYGILFCMHIIKYSSIIIL